MRRARRRRSIGGQRAIGWRSKTPADVDAALVGLVDRVTRRLRDGDRVARTVTLRLRFDDSARISRAHTLAHPTAETAVVLATARQLLAAEGDVLGERGITLVAVSLSQLDDTDAVQLALPFGRGVRDGPDITLDQTRDEIRSKFGNRALERTSLLHRAAGIVMPQLPDPGS